MWGVQILRDLIIFYHKMDNSNDIYEAKFKRVSKNIISKSRIFIYRDTSSY